MSINVKILTLALLLLCAVGCDFRGGAESAHPLFKNAEAARENGKYQEATDFFHRYLEVRYDSPQTHLRLATLYDENLDEPLQAVYHYQQFLHYSTNSPEREQVKKWLKAAKRKYYLHARLKYNDPEDVEMLKNSLEKNRAKLTRTITQNRQLLNYIEGIKKQLAASNQEITKLKLTKEKAVVDLELAQEKLDQLQNKNAALVREQNALRNKLQTIEEPLQDLKETTTAELPSAEMLDEESTDAATPESADETNTLTPEFVEEPENSKTPPAKLSDNNTTSDVKVIPLKPVESPKIPDPKREKTQTYQVQRGDTLIKISRRFYGTGKHYKLIFEANRHILASESSLSPGQILNIPVLSEN